MKKKLGEIAEVFSGFRVYRLKENTDITEKKVIRRLNNEGELKTEIKKVSKDLNEKYFTQKGDILIPLANPENVIKVNEEGLIVPMYYAVVRTKQKYNNDYVYYALKKIIPREMGKLTEGTVLKSIRINYLSQIEIPIDESNKHEDIIETLDLINEKKRPEEKLIQLNEELEKALINQMFIGD